jgi:hypothetical protein
MIALGDIAIIGGGCYGTFYSGQLEAARTKGALEYRRLLLIDRDPACRATTLPADPMREVVCREWGSFLDNWLDRGQRDRDGLADMIVPSPFMPHLMAEWLQRQGEARWPSRGVVRVPAEKPLGTPYDQLHADGVRYVSHADWLCPTHCIEPLRCPATRAPRTWEMGETVADWTRSLALSRPTVGPALFTCEHVTHGVGMYPARRAFEGLAHLATLAEHPEGGDLVVGSVSSCHGAVALLRLGPGTP